MEKKTSFIKRYYKCLFDFKLFKSYLSESTGKAILFLLPVFLVFSMLSYTESLKISKGISEHIDGYYDHILSLKNKDLLENPTSGGSDKIKASFKNGKILVDQDKVYEGTFDYKGASLKLIIDTDNLLDVSLDPKNDYSKAERKKFAYDSEDMVVFVGEDFIILNKDERVYSYDLSNFTEDRGSILGMYTFVSDNFIPYTLYILTAIVYNLILFIMYYLVTYFISKSYMKKKELTIEKNKIRKVVCYAMQPGMYLYIILNVINTFTALNLAWIMPLASMLAMYYIATKTIDEMQDYIKIQRRKERKKKARVKGQ